MNAPPKSLLFPYGDRNIETPIPPNFLGVIEAPEAVTAPNERLAIREALQFPIGAPTIKEWIKGAHRVAILIPDQTRALPLQLIIDEVLDAIEPTVRATQITFYVANGTHSPAQFTNLGLSTSLLSHYAFVNHQASDPEALIELGSTALGTPVIINKQVAASDRILILGQIQPHYFAGFSGGYKGLFPGVGGKTAIRKNHELKSHPTSRLGQVSENVCREDMEEMGDFLPSAYLVNVILNRKNRIHAVVAGDPIKAHRLGCSICRDITQVPVRRRADIVMISDGFPLASTLYQLSKLVAPAGWMIKDGGCIILMGQCNDGVGDLDAVNQVIYQWGLTHYLPDDHQIYLVSDMKPELTGTTYASYQPNAEEALKAAFARLGHRATVLAAPGAGDLIPLIEEVDDIIIG